MYKVRRQKAACLAARVGTIKRPGLRFLRTKEVRAHVDFTCHSRRAVRGVRRHGRRCVRRIERSCGGRPRRRRRLERALRGERNEPVRPGQAMRCHARLREVYERRTMQRRPLLRARRLRFLSDQRRLRSRCTRVLARRSLVSPGVQGRGLVSEGRAALQRADGSLRRLQQRERLPGHRADL